MQFVSIKSVVWLAVVTSIGCREQVEAEPSLLEFEWRPPSVTVQAPSIVLPPSGDPPSATHTAGELDTRSRFYLSLDVTNRCQPPASAPALRVFARPLDRPVHPLEATQHGTLTDHRLAASPSEYRIDCLPLPSAGRFLLEIKETDVTGQVVALVEVTVAHRP
jgi:hypothetical protein